MVSAVMKKSWNDLKIKKSRTIFIILTISLSVSGLGLFAVVPLMDQAMEDEVNNSNMYDLRLFTNNLELNDKNFNELENLENIESADGKYYFYSRIYIGERRNDAIFVGIEDFLDQNVDVVDKTSGNYPGFLQVLSDSGNRRTGLFGSTIGDTVRAYNSNGSIVELEITGFGDTLTFSLAPYGIAVFYTDMETIHALSEGTGYNLLSFHLEKSTEQDADLAAKNIQAYLSTNTNFESMSRLPEIREDGDWPGKDDLGDMGSFFYILTFIAMFCSLFLISNTMHTLVSEQRKEIAQMKAVGATRKQILKSYMTTSLLIGLFGSVFGVILGTVIGYAMTDFLLGNFFGVNPDFAIYWPIAVLSALVGIGITILAALPALYKSMKISVREGMEGVSLTKNGSSKYHKSLLRFGRLPRSAQMGIRNISRKKGRSISTIIQVALAVGIFLSISTIGYTLSVTIEDEFDNFTFDIMTSGQTDGAKPLTGSLRDSIEDIDGVAVAEPFIGTMVMVDEWELMCFGYYHDTIAFNYRETIHRGRWYDENEENSMANVVVLGKSLARVENIEVDDIIDIRLATGVFEFKVVGISTSHMGNGKVAYMPFATLQHILAWNDTVSGFSIKTESGSHDDIDRVSTEVEDRMMNSGFVVNNQIMYVAEEQNQREVGKIMDLMMAVGGLVVLITMVGLMSTLTMNVIERTKEVGMMRCIGSKAGHIRSVFGVEGLTLGIIGWVVGIPLGYLIGSYINYKIYDLMQLDMTYLFPMNYILIAFLLTVAISTVIIQPPLWRATHLRPGDALRYE